MSIDFEKYFYYDFNGKLFKMSKNKDITERSIIYFVYNILNQDVINGNRKNIKDSLKDGSNEYYSNVHRLLEDFYIKFNEFNSLIHIEHLSLFIIVDLMNKRIRKSVIYFKPRIEDSQIVELVSDERKDRSLKWDKENERLVIKLENINYDTKNEDLDLQKILLVLLKEFMAKECIVFYTNKEGVAIFPNTISIMLAKELKDEKTIKNLMIKNKFK